VENAIESNTLTTVDATELAAVEGGTISEYGLVIGIIAVILQPPPPPHPPVKH
jgi:hypothetical protein